MRATVDRMSIKHVTHIPYPASEIVSAWEGTRPNGERVACTILSDRIFTYYVDTEDGQPTGPVRELQTGLLAPNSDPTLYGDHAAALWCSSMSIDTHVSDIRKVNPNGWSCVDGRLSPTHLFGVNHETAEVQR